MKLSVYQGECIRGNVMENINIIDRIANEAAKNESSMVVFPELFLCGYDIGPKLLRECSITKNGKEMTKIKNIAKKHNIHLAVPYSEKEEDKIYNSVIMIGTDGEIVHNYRKCHLWSSYEKGVFTEGNQDDMKVFNICGIPSAFLICYDLEFPEPARELALRGARLLIVPTALASGFADDQVPSRVANTRAVENQCFVAYCNFPQKSSKGSTETDKHVINFCGQSGIIGADGMDLSRANRSQTILLTSPIHPSTYSAFFDRNPYFVDRRATLYPSISKSKL